MLLRNINSIWARGTRPSPLRLTHEKQHRFYIVAHESDLTVFEQLDCSFRPILLDDQGRLSNLTPDPIPDVDAISTQVLGAFAFTSFSYDRLHALLPGAELLLKCHIQDIDFVDGPDLHTLNSLFQSRIIDRLLDSRAQKMERNIALNRALSVLRREMSEIQIAFSKLEQFVNAGGRAARKLTAVLPPQTPPALLFLRDGDVLLQRFPGSSAGLTDIAIYVAVMPPSDGILQCWLETIEDEVQHGCWTMTTDKLSTGWLRLALPIALEPDMRTPRLRCCWSGAQDLVLDLGAPHPDPRFNLRVNDVASHQTLALKTWIFVPGCAAPLTMDGHLDDGHPPKMRHIPLEMLREAENLNVENPHFHFHDDFAGLLVHPMGQGVSAGRLRQAIPKGARRMSIDIRTMHHAGPQVEYAAIVAHPTRRALSQMDLATFVAAHDPAWQRISAMEESQIHLDLGNAAQESLDLYLITRLPPDASFEFGWAVFSNARIEF